MSEFLLEIYSEEIPAKLQDKILKPFAETFLNHFSQLGFIYESLQVEVSACRIAVFCDKIELSKKEIEPLRGPAINANQAAINGFLKKYNIPDTSKLTHQNGYYYYKPNTEISTDLKSILATNLPKIIDSCQAIWPRRMRWNKSGKEWIRPIRNLLCLVGKEIIDFEYAGLRTNNITFGNKNITNRSKIEVFGILDYLEKLENNFVILSRKKRIEIIETQLKKVERQYDISFKLDRNKHLISEVAGLCEYLVLGVCKIPDHFLSIPECTIEQKIKNDQRYFVPYNSKNELSQQIAMFVEATPNNINDILQGNMKVLNARLSDVEFFYKKDINLFSKYSTIDKSAVKDLLCKIPVGDKLGNLYDRVCRISEIMHNLRKIGGNDILGGLDIDIISLYLKLDMSTFAYKEFPDLQGYIGAEYATKIWNLPAEYSDVFAAQHGLNVGYGEHVPAIANTLEYVASHLYIGTEFTSSSDPFAIERSINFISSIYEWVPNIGLHTEAVKCLLPKMFESVAEKLSDILIKSAKKINIKRLKKKFEDYQHINEICNHYFDYKISYFECQNKVDKALNWINISEDSQIIVSIYKRCKNISESKQVDNIKINLVEWSQINEMLDLFDSTISNNDINTNLSKIAWNALALDLDRYFSNYKISDSIDRIIFVKNIVSKIDTKYPFLNYIKIL